MHLKGAVQKSKNSRQPSSPNNKPSHYNKVEAWEFNDTQTGILLGIPRSARCVQRFDDSLNSAIHITYRISLRSSSMREPRDPLLKVVLKLSVNKDQLVHSKTLKSWYDIDREESKSSQKSKTSEPFKLNEKPQRISNTIYNRCTGGEVEKAIRRAHTPKSQHQPYHFFSNDPSAGSPTETLLRLLLPLNDQVWSTSQQRNAVSGFPKPIRRPH